MAQLAPPSGGPARISQLLPSVKCSTCSAPVPLDQLGEHVCDVPPLPSPPKPAAPPKSPSSMLAFRLQNVLNPNNNRKSSSSRSRAPSTSSVSSYSSVQTASTARRSRQPSLPSVRSPSPPPPPALPQYRPQQPQSPPTYGLSPNISDRPVLSRSPSPVSTIRSAGRSPSSTPSPRPPSSNSSRSRRPSNASTASSFLPPQQHRTGSPSSSSSPAPIRPRVASNASSIRHHQGLRRPSAQSISPPAPPPTNSLPPPPTEPSSNPPPSSPQLPQHPRSPQPASVPFPSSPTNTTRYPSPAPSPSHYSQQNHGPEIDTKSGGEAGMAGVGRRGFAAAARAAMFAQNMQGGGGEQHMGLFKPPAAPAELASPAGMDGRRANAPKWLDIGRVEPDAKDLPVLSSSPNSLSPSSPTHHLNGRAHSPRSPSPLSSTTPTRADHALPRDNIRDSNSTITGGAPNPYSPTSPTGNRLQLNLNSPSSIPFPSQQPQPWVHSSEPQTPTTPTTPRLPFFEKYRNKFADVPVKVNGENDDEEDGHNNGKPLRSPTDDESELGLAYADSEDDQQHVVHTSPRRNPSGASSSSAYSRGGGGAGLDNAMEALLRSPGSSSADLDFDVPIVPPTPTNNGFGIGAGAGAGGSPGLKPVKLPVRSHTSPSQRDSARVAPGGVGSAAALNVGLNGARRGGTISGAIGGGHGHGHHGHGHDDDDATSVAESEVAAGKKASVSTGTSGSSSSSSRKPRVRDCVRCGKRIEDGRWIRVESGKGVLCDRCWKNMYLPKCRRCNLPIEKQAVSSSDGQLKGKYHRDCFNCHTCQKPFPDKSFYVLEGKPFCAYHYHEANGSLCAARGCGQPIEGECAVSHEGERYHPGCLTCEWDGGSEEDEEEEEDESDYGEDEDEAPRRRGRCTERLVEYWEVEGKMLCEKHMRVAVEDDRGDLDSRTSGSARGRGGLDVLDNTRALKRVTRFIDIQDLGGMGLR